MTLVAAFSIEGIPVLIGDLLLTDTDVRRNHVRLPTRPGLENMRPATGRNRIHGFRKKIQKIGDRLAVGFAGDVTAGRLLLRALDKRFSKGPFVLRDLQAFLANFNCRNLKKMYLVGWAFEKRMHSFHWCSASPAKFDLIPFAAAGSGVSHFKNEILPSESSGRSSEITDSLDKAIYTSVMKAGRVLSTEILKGKNLEYDYGFGLEVMLWDGAKFFYVDKIAYAFWDININSDNSFSALPGSISAIYENKEKFCLMQVSQVRLKTGFLPGFSASETEVHMITPIHDSMDDFDVRGLTAISYEDAQLWFSGFVVKNPLTGGRIEFSLVSEYAEDMESPLVSYKHGVLYLNTKLLREMLPDWLFNVVPTA